MSDTHNREHSYEKFCPLYCGNSETGTNRPLTSFEVSIGVANVVGQKPKPLLDVRKLETLGKVM